MCGSRGHNINRIAGIHQLFSTIKPFKLIFFRNSKRYIIIGVKKANKVYAFNYKPIV